MNKLNKFCWAQVPNAAYQAPRSFALWFRRRVLKRFYNTWAWPYMAPNRLSFPHPMEARSIRNLALIGPAVSEEKTFKEYERWTDGRRNLPILTHEPELKMVNKQKCMTTNTFE